MIDNIVLHSYNDHQIRQRVDDDYVCLTDLAKSEGKKLHDYLRLDDTKAYVEALSAETGIPVSGLLIVKKGGNDRGLTYAHPEVAMDCAQWVSIPCRIWANRTLVRVVKQQGTIIDCASQPFADFLKARSDAGLEPLTLEEEIKAYKLLTRTLRKTAASFAEKPASTLLPNYPDEKLIESLTKASRRLGWLTVGVAKNSCYATKQRKIPMIKMQKILVQLAERGIGAVQGNGAALTWHC